MVPRMVQHLRMKGMEQLRLVEMVAMALGELLVEGESLVEGELLAEGE